MIYFVIFMNIIDAVFILGMFNCTTVLLVGHGQNKGYFTFEHEYKLKSYEHLST